MHGVQPRDGAQPVSAGYPCLGLIGWFDFVKSVKVATFVVGEPRRRVPVQWIRKILEETDLDDFSAVQLAFILVILYFTHSRSEPFPRNHTGEESFDGGKHWYVRDFTVRSFPFGFLFAVRFKGIKQDPRLERDGAAGDGYEWGAAASLGGYDFTYVGDVPGSVFSVFLWFRRFMSFFSQGRDPQDYMFLDPDRTRPLTYRVLTGQFKAALVAVGYEGPPVGLHGVRVEGYNNNKAANGEDVAAVQGLWMGPKAGGHGRYNRFSMVQVSNTPARMLGQDDTYADAAQPRRISRNLQPAFQAAEGDGDGPVVVNLASPASSGSGEGSSSSGHGRGGDWTPGNGGVPAPGIMAAHLPLAAPRRSPPASRRGRGRGRGGGRGRRATTSDA